MAHELFPSDIALFDKTHIKGIIIEKGSKHSHASIMIKSLGIPHLIGVSDYRLLFNQDDFIILDTVHSEVIVNPDSGSCHSCPCLVRTFLLLRLGLQKLLQNLS
jgi:phosphotransferase system enzyme I (PtsI)